MAIKLAINGFGRIGRSVVRILEQYPEIELTAINDLGDVSNLLYLLKYDTPHGIFDKGTIINADGNSFLFKGKVVSFTQIKNPEELPWGKLGIDVVVESTGVFESYEKAALHKKAGAKHVIISAPAKGEDTHVEGITSGMKLVGIHNDADFSSCDVTSNGSCTTNSIAVMMDIMSKTVGVQSALLNTIHSYTATQAIVDSPDKSDFRRGRAGAANIVPSTTGAAKALSKVVGGFPFDGIAIRVPTIVGSVADVTFITKRETNMEEINGIFETASLDPKYKGIFTATYEQIVSSDIIGNTHASIVDLSFTKVAGGNLVKVLAWYDNEYGYAHTLIRHILSMMK